VVNWGGGNYDDPQSYRKAVCHYFARQEARYGLGLLDHSLGASFPADILGPGYIIFVAPVALWPQYSCFFWQVKPCLKLQGEPRLSRYDVVRILLEGDNLRGTIMTRELQPGGGRKAGRPNLSLFDARTWRWDPFVLAPVRFMFFSHSGRWSD